MRLETVGLTGRRFMIQFSEILREFGDEIPWLHGTRDLRFATNGRVFRDVFLRETEQFGGIVTPYQFVDNDAFGTLVGGVLHFDRSPEHFVDSRNIAIMETLMASGSNYLSCLQVRPYFQNRGIGQQMARRAAEVILRDRGCFWGVISHFELLPFYLNIGARLHSPRENQDNLWIISW